MKRKLCLGMFGLLAAMGSINAEAATVPNGKLPSLPAGVTELKFTEFFVTPIGPRGLELTEKLSACEGKRVRMLGFMVRQDTSLPGKFLFTAMPVDLHDHDSSDDLPPAVVHVFVPTCRDKQVPYAPGLMLLTGTLSIGHREEADGRMSLVRLALDPPEPPRPASTAKGAERLMSRLKSGRDTPQKQLSQTTHQHTH
jgi:hypothetical protein